MENLDQNTSLSDDQTKQDDARLRGPNLKARQARRAKVERKKFQRKKMIRNKGEVILLMKL